MILAEHISIVTPTYRRHAQLTRMLSALSHHTEKVGQIIIADGGRDAEVLIAGFAEALPLEWMDCEVRGQIAQRNAALVKLRADCRVVLYMDDDIVLAPDCIAVLVAFWNAQPTAPGGVGLNILNMPDQPDSPFRRLFLMASRPMGKVWKSGYNTPVTGTETDFAAQWLNGGATAWRRDVVERHRNAAVKTSWAVGEDLMFSYPISKVEALRVCAAARCTHEDDAPPVSFAGGRFRAYRGVVSRYVFVRSNAELSSMLFFWMIFGQILGRLARALRGQRAGWGYLVGTLEASRDCLLKTGAKDFASLLSE
jgi:glycosyltransferase involved in cell wall biosynthesis